MGVLSTSLLILGLEWIPKHALMANTWSARSSNFQNLVFKFLPPLALKAHRSSLSRCVGIPSDLQA